MKKRMLILLACLLLFCILPAGCGKKETADDYLRQQITSAKETDGALAGTLEDGIADIKESEEFVVDFPENLKDSYEAFLKEALKQVEFELNKADRESEDTYKVRVTYAPIDLASATEAANSEYVKNISSADFAAEVKNLLKDDADLLETADKQQKKSQTIMVQKKDGVFSVKEEDLNALFADALPGYMAPYTAVAAVFDMRDFIQADLDASIKGETERYEQHTGMSAEEAMAQYDESFSSFAMDEFSDEENSRFINTMKTIFHNCQYTLGAVRQYTLTEYEFDITIIPNTSVQSAIQEFESGTYSSEEEAKAGLLDIYDKYAAAPTYGEETSITVTWDSFDMLNQNESDSEYDQLMDTMLPAE